MTVVETAAYVVAGLALLVSLALLVNAAHKQNEKFEPTSSTYDSSLPVGPAERGTRQTVLVQVTLAAAALALLAGLASRAAVGRRWPLSTPFEFTLACSACGLLVCMLLLRSVQMARVAAFAIAPSLALLLHAVLIQPVSARAVQAINPVMAGFLFLLHTSLTALAFGALEVAGGSALGCLVRATTKAGALVDRAMDLAYVILSLGMITGAMWGEQAWGDYWSWSIKEVWTLITWLTCALYQHVRFRRGWQGTRVLFVAVLALAAAATTFLGTPALVRWTRLYALRIY